jgi:hypothetical protein
VQYSSPDAATALKCAHIRLGHEVHRLAVAGRSYGGHRDR